LVFAVIELTTNFNDISYTFPLFRQSDTEYSSDVRFISFNENDLISIYLSMGDITEMDIALRNPKTSMKDCPEEYFTNEQLNKTRNFANTSALYSTVQAAPCGEYMSFYPEGTFQVINS